MTCYRKSNFDSNYFHDVSCWVWLSWWNCLHICENCNAYLKKPLLLTITRWIIRQSAFESSTSSNIIKLSTRISHYYENIFDVKRPPVKWHLRWQERIYALFILPCLQQHSGNISSSVFYIIVHITNLSFLYNRFNVPTLTAKILYFLYDN